MSYNDTVKAARLTVVRDAIDAGATGGKLELGDIGLVNVMAIITFDTVSGVAITDTLTMSGFPKNTTGLVAGTPVEARIVDSNDVLIKSGLTVGTIGTEDVVLDAPTISIGQTLTINSAVITHGA